jgi:hypothetical protein
VRRPLAFVQIDHSFRVAEKQLRAAIRTVNHQAAKLLGKGKYEEAETMVALARGALRFQDRFDSIVTEWREVTGKASHGKAKSKVPLWRYYVVVARALAGVGGEGVIEDIVANIEATLKAEPTLQASLGMAMTTAEWKRTTERARGPMRQHGYIELLGQGRWRITKLGGDLASRPEV